MGTSKEKYLRQYEIDGNCTECLGNNLLRRYGIDMNENIKFLFYNPFGCLCQDYKLWSANSVINHQC
jgi:hypothetical protein